MKIITFGCRLNSFESAVIQKLSDDLDNVILFNTCAVTGEAERQCRQAIRKARRENPNARIIVAGCAAQLHPEIYAAMPEVDRVLGNHEKMSVDALKGTEKIMVGDMARQPTYLPVVSQIEGKAKAFLQIQQGCDHACTFCVVSQIRGLNTGLKPEMVLKQAQTFVDNGYPELVITGVDVTGYPYGFCEIIRRLLSEVNGLKRLRFGSLDPACLDDEFVALMASDNRLMPHLHLSIQAGDNLILKRMGRRHNREDVIALTQKIRAIRPDAVFGADFITGFPTETDAQFNQTMDLVKTAGLTHLHVFPYSARSGTPAAKMPQVDIHERKERAKKLRSLGEEMYGHLLDSQIGRTLKVLIEKDGTGYSENYLKVKTALNGKTGEIVDVAIKGREANELVG